MQKPPSPRPDRDARQEALPFGDTPAPRPQAPLDDAQRLACLRLIRSESIGPVTFRELINRFGGASRALEALPDLAHRSGRRKPLRICPADVAAAELAAARRIGAVPLFTIEPGYPPLLAHLDMPPPMVYAMGRLDMVQRPGIAIVGSRDASVAGRTLTRTLARDLARAGFVIVSGLARGIDREAHETAIESGTIAVLAGGIDVVYPPEHAYLHDQISDMGCLITELPPGYEPRGPDFPRRNRIISGMSHAVVVVEAARRSGSLITARLAAEQGRDVFAVPGHPLDPRAEGTNHLIKGGATLVTSAADIIEAVNPTLASRFTFRDTTQSHWSDPPVTHSTPAQPLGLGIGSTAAESSPSPRSTALTSVPLLDADSVRSRVASELGPAPVSIDDLARVTGLPVRAIQGALLELSLAGQIERHGQNLVSRIAPDNA